MVIQGEFAYVTLAVYGDAASEPPLDPVSYEPTPLPDVLYHRLSPALDLASSKEPTLLPRELFSLVSHAPSLSDAIRHIFCPKLSDEDRDGDHFSSLEDCATTDLSGTKWLERAAEALMMPVNEDISLDSLRKFAEKIPRVLAEKVR